MYLKPLEASNAFLDNPILKLLGWNLPIFSEPPLIPPVVRKEVIAKLIAFVYLKSYQGRDQDLRNNP
jgi:hypothetical protein